MELQGILNAVFNSSNPDYAVLNVGPVNHTGTAAGAGRGEAQGSIQGMFDSANNRLRVSVAA